MASGLSSNDHGEGVMLDLKQLNMAPDPIIDNLGHNFVTLKWSLIKDQRSYIIEEKDEYGIGRVFVGNVAECTLKGLEALSTHNYRLVIPTQNGQITSKWITVLTTKEPITADYLTRACRSKDLPRLRSLLEDVTRNCPRPNELINALDTKGLTPLMMCCIEGFTDGVCVLLSYGIDIDKKNNDYRTALMWACINGNTEIVNILIDNGANLTRTDRSGTNCLFCAADSDNPSTVKSVLNQNIIPVNLHNPSGWTVLHKLAAVNDVESSSEMVKILVEKGANINLRDKNGNTPILLAIINGNIHMVKALLHENANLTIENDLGNSPMTMAGSTEFVSRGPKSKTISSLLLKKI